MSMTAMCAGDVVGALEGFANTHRNRFLPYIKMCQTGHQRPRVEFIDLAFELADGCHLPVHAPPPIYSPRNPFWRGGRCHLATPDIRASTSNTTAKSSFSQPMPLAAVRNSLLTAVVGRGTFNLRPISIASSMSFCIMLTSNQASSGCCRTKGPRYWIMGDATAL